MDGDFSNVPGSITTEEELRTLGFVRLTLEIVERDLPLQRGLGFSFNTVGDVPDSPGIYVFTIQRDGVLRVVYAGMTTHLWMVTKGRLPRSGGERGGQRYGRPKYAGETRQRINVLLWEQCGQGFDAAHWVLPLTKDAAASNELGTIKGALIAQEELLIAHWKLRMVGWNRG